MSELVSGPQLESPPPADDGSARTALRSTALMGSASLISLSLGLVRTKCLALLLGPSGVGLAGAYSSINAMVTTVAGMGLNTSGVRQIAAAVGAGDPWLVSRTAHALRRVALLLGLLGAGLTVALSPWLSRLTFGTREHQFEIALLAVVVCLGAVSGGQIALVQGMRRLGTLARMNVIGAVIGTLVSIPLVWAMGERGIVPFLIVTSAAGVVSAWWHVRRIELAPLTMSIAQSLREAAPLLRLGFAFMLSGLMTAGVAYLVRAIIVRSMGLDAAGHYQAGAALASLYVGFVLSAMGSDFYPRLTAIASDRRAAMKAVNEQIELSLLIAGPGIAFTVAVAPWVLVVFYSKSFVPAAEVLQWQALGVLLQVASWPLGFIIVAQGRGRLFITTEVLANSVYLAALWLLTRRFGLPGTGMAFASQYTFYMLLMIVTARQLIRFRYERAAIEVMLVVAAFVAAAFSLRFMLSPVWAATVGTGLTIGLALYSIHTLNQRVPNTRPARWCRSVLQKVGLRFDRE